MSEEPYISILTPAFNRKEFLPILIKSLSKQSFKNFEWVIGNDGSSDGTEQYLREELAKQEFSVTYISSDLRIGKSSIDNYLLNYAKGKYIMWCDSDDFLVEDSLERLVKIIEENKLHSNESVAGIIAQNLDTDGISQSFDRNKRNPKKGFYSWQELEELLIGDATVCVKRKIYSDSRFPEIDFLTIESIILRDLYKPFKFFLTDEVVKIMDRSAENSVSHGKKLQYCRGSAYSISQTINYDRYDNMSLIQKIILVIQYFRYCIHGDLGFMDSVGMWKSLKRNYSLIIFYPISFTIAIKDILMRKVEKTHIKFNENRPVAKVSINYFNKG